MLGAGTIINPILKIVTVVAVLAAVYLFIVKPILDTTNDAFDQFGGAFGDLPSSIQDQVDEAFNQLDDDTARKRLERCIKEAGSNTQRIDRCVERFTG
jgi:hypothetical protein